jgi:hypothetical protein
LQDALGHFPIFSAEAAAEAAFVIR